MAGSEDHSKNKREINVDRIEGQSGGEANVAGRDVIHNTTQFIKAYWIVIAAGIIALGLVAAAGIVAISFLFLQITKAL